MFRFLRVIQRLSGYPFLVDGSTWRAQNDGDQFMPNPSPYSQYTKKNHRRIIAVCVTFLSIVLLLATKNLSASHGNALSLKNNEKEFVGDHVRYVWDEKHQLSIQQALQKPIDQWQISKQQTINFGYSDATLWLRLDLQGFRGCDLHQLTMDYPLIDDIQFYHVVNRQVVRKYQTGDQYAFTQRPIQYRTFAFPFHCQHPNSTIFLKIKSTSSLLIPLSVTSSNQFWESEQWTLLGQGLYFGIMLVLVLYNIFIFITTREKVFGFYVGYVLVYALVQGGLHGFNFQILWPNSPDWNQVSIALLVSATVYFGCQFTESFLELKNYSARHSQMIQWIGYSGLISLPLAIVLPYQFAIFISMLLTIIGTVAITYAGSMVWIRHRHFPAAYFTIAWLTFLFGSNVISLVRLGIVPSNFVTENAAQIGSALEVILLSFALSVRMRRLQKNQKQAESIAREVLERSNRYLLETAASKDEFVQCVSEQLNSPINALKECVSDIQPSDKPNSHTLQQLNEHIKNVSAVMDQLTLYSDIQNSRFQKNVQTIVLNPFLDQVVKPLQNVAREKKLLFTVNYSRQLPESIKTDKQLLSRLLNAICLDAIQRTEHGEISLSVSSVSKDHQEAIIFALKDNGKFPFHSEHTEENLVSYSARVNDLHTMLSLKIVRLLNGDIQVHPQQDSGNETLVLIPSSIHHKPKKKDSKKTPLRQLAITNEADLRSQLKQVAGSAGIDLELTDFEHVPAYQIKQGHYDQIIIDVDENDIFTLQTIHQIGVWIAGTPTRLIVCSEQLSTNTQMRFKDIGIDSTFAKPIDPSYLLKVIQMEDFV